MGEEQVTLKETFDLVESHPFASILGFLLICVLLYSAFRILKWMDE